MYLHIIHIYGFIYYYFILESVQNDDGEDDPEYNVLGDDDFTNGNY